MEKIVRLLLSKIGSIRTGRLSKCSMHFPKYFKIARYEIIFLMERSVVYGPSRSRRCRYQIKKAEKQIVGKASCGANELTNLKESSNTRQNVSLASVLRNADGRQSQVIEELLQQTGHARLPPTCLASLAGSALLDLASERKVCLLFPNHRDVVSYNP